MAGPSIYLRGSNQHRKAVKPAVPPPPPAGAHVDATASATVIPFARPDSARGSDDVPAEAPAVPFNGRAGELPSEQGLLYRTGRDSYGFDTNGIHQATGSRWSPYGRFGTSFTCRTAVGQFAVAEWRHRDGSQGFDARAVIDGQAVELYVEPDSSQDGVRPNHRRYVTYTRSEQGGSLPGPSGSFEQPNGLAIRGPQLERSLKAAAAMHLQTAELASLLRQG